MQIVPTKPTQSKSNKKRNRKAKVRLSRRRQHGRPEESVFLATRERMRQPGGIIEEQVAVSPYTRETVKRHRASCECQLDVYRRDGKIDESEHRAGLEFRAAWLFKAHGIRTIDSTTLSCIDGSAPMTVEEKLKNKNWAEKTLNDAFKEASLTIGQTLVVTKVCGEDDFVGTDCDVRTLRRGLEKLARFWSF
jgi:hypothetical protein